MGFRNKKGGRVEKSSIEYILHNIAYIGKFYYNDILVENTDYPPIINESTFYLVQDKLNDPSKTRQTHTEYVYNNVVKCAKCACALTGETHKKKLKDGSIKRYIHYHCTGNRGGEYKKSSYIREELIEQAVVNL